MWKLVIKLCPISGVLERKRELTWTKEHTSDEEPEGGVLAAESCGPVVTGPRANPGLQGAEQKWPCLSWQLGRNRDTRLVPAEKTLPEPWLWEPPWLL